MDPGEAVGKEKSRSYSVVRAHVFGARVYLLRIRPKLVAPTSVPANATECTINAFLRPRQCHCVH